MSIKPVAWLYEQHIDGVPAKFTPPEVKFERFNGKLGAYWTETPLYSAPAPELAEALRRLEVTGANFYAMVEGESPSLLEDDHNAYNFQHELEAVKLLLARITPK